MKKKIKFLILMVAASAVIWVAHKHLFSRFWWYCLRGDIAWDNAIWGTEPRPQRAKYYGKALMAWTPTDGIQEKIHVLALRADLLNLQGNLQEAISAYSVALSLDPKRADLFLNRGKVYYYMNQGMMDEAISDFTKCIELSPSNAEAYGDRGRVFFSKGKYLQAVADFTEAIKKDQLGDFEAAYNYRYRAETFEKLGLKDKAASDRNNPVFKKYYPR